MEESMYRITASLSLTALLVSACASTSFVSVWRSPSAKPLHLKGEKVAAVVMMQNPTKRRAAEERLAHEITERGAVGVPLYRIMPNATAGDEEKVRAALEQANFKAAVVMRPAGTKQEIHVSAEPGYDRFYGGYYGYGWSASYSRDPRYNVYTDTIVSVDNRVYSLTQNQLVWAGESKTTNPDNVDEFVVELAAAVADELSRAGLIE
jgi:hypothetical protein